MSNGSALQLVNGETKNALADTAATGSVAAIARSSELFTTGDRRGVAGRVIDKHSISSDDNARDGSSSNSSASSTSSTSSSSSSAGSNSSNENSRDVTSDTSGNVEATIYLDAVRGSTAVVDETATTSSERHRQRCRTSPVDYRDSSRSTTTTTTTTTSTTSATLRSTTDGVNQRCVRQTEQSYQQHHRKSGSRRSAAATTLTNDNNMVAAVNEHHHHHHLSNSSSDGRATMSASATTSTASAVCSRNNNNNNINKDPDGERTSEDDVDKTSAGILSSFPCDFDHMYASMTDGGGGGGGAGGGGSGGGVTNDTPSTTANTAAAGNLGVSPLRGNEARQNDLAEVKHLKELLLLHLDLIQQQSEQIVTKDKLLAALRQENETLKLRLERMDRRVSLQKLRSESSENSVTSEHVGTCSPSAVNSVTVPSTSNIHRNVQSETGNVQYNESFKIRLNTSGGITTVKQDHIESPEKYEVKQEPSNDTRLEWESKKKRRSDRNTLGNRNNKRIRGVSCSSTVSNDTTSTTREKSHHSSNRKLEKKGKSLMKKEYFLTTEEHYYTAVGESNYALSLKEPMESENSSNLEVPNWRVKIYTSCYTMEGTENLDDEIFNKRHLKLENDERRRKRWDVQRIREQRHIEKLKLRQERQNHHATCYNTNHTGPCPSSVEEESVTTLWPEIEQIQSLQVDPQLPVTAFGVPIPSFTPSEFTLPWCTTRSKNRRSKRSTGRRKTCRR